MLSAREAHEMSLLAWHEGKVGQETYDMISYLFELRTSVPAKMDRYRHAALDLET